MSETPVWRKLFRMRWSQTAPDKARAIIQSYLTIGQAHRGFLADIALDNFVFSSAPAAPDLYHAGIAEGRRQCALEIFQRCSVNPQLLWELVEQRPGRKE